MAVIIGLLALLAIGGCRATTSNDQLNGFREVAMAIPCDKDNCGKRPDVPR